MKKSVTIREMDNGFVVDSFAPCGDAPMYDENKQLVAKTLEEAITMLKEILNAKEAKTSILGE